MYKKQMTVDTRIYVSIRASLQRENQRDKFMLFDIGMNIG